MTCTPLTECLCCGSAGLQPFLDLGAQPPANAYHDGTADPPRFPLAVNRCGACWHWQLTHVVDRSLLFDHYPYVSGTSQTLRAHFAELADELTTDYGAGRVLEVACNDGTLLALLRRRGWEVYGVDPAANLRERTAAQDIPVTVGYWGEAEPLRAEGAPYRAVVATNVLAHVPNPRRFLRQARAALAPGGVIVVEVPSLDSLWRQHAFDTIYHEHLSYFSLHSLAVLAGRSGLDIVAWRRRSIHGGTLRVYLEVGGNAEVEAGLFAQCRGEQSQGLDDLAEHRRWALEIRETAKMLRSRLHARRIAGIKIVGYGASAKASTLLNYLNAPLVDYFVDDNPLKQGLRIPGQDIPIRPPAALRDEPGLVCVLATAWNFLDEITAKIRGLRGDRPTTLVTYVPAVAEHFLPTSEAA